MAPAPLPGLTRRERHIMDILCRLGRATAPQHRKLLEQAIAALDQQLAELDG